MSRTRNNLNKIRKRNVFIVVLILICLVAIYTFNFSTKSEVVPKTTMKFTELGTSLAVSDDLEFYEDEEGSYVVFPERVAGYQVKQYLVPNVYEIEEVEEPETEDTNTSVQDEVSNTISDNNSNTTTENEETNEVLENNTVNENRVNTNTTENNTVTNTNANTNTTKNVTSENVIDNATVEKTAVVGKTNTHETSQEVDNEKVSTDNSEVVNEVKANTEIVENTVVTETNTIAENTITNTIVENTVTENTIAENTTTNTTVENNKTDAPVAQETTVEETPVEKTADEQTNEDELQTKELSNVIYYDESAERDLEDVNIEGMTSYKPGDKVYFSKEDIDSNAIEISVVLKTIRINGVDLYNQELIEDTGVSVIKVTGYIPAEFKLEVNADDKERIEELKSDVDELKDTSVLVAYDIKIKKDEVEYQPMNYFQAVDVSFCSPSEFENNLINSEITILHIKEDEEKNEIVFEKVAVDTKTEDTVECRTNEFSTYAIIKNNEKTVDKITVYDFDSDYNYYTGKSIVERQCAYPSVYDAEGSNQKLAKFTINYYSYDSSRNPSTVVNLAKTSEYNISANTTYADYPGPQDYVIGREDTFPYNNIYGYSSYTRTYTVNFTLNLVNENYVDTSKQWSLTFDVPSNILVDSLSNNGLSGVNYDADAGTLTLSGNNMNNWTRNSLTQYTFSYQVPFNIMKEDHTGYNNMNFPVSNINFVGAKRLLTGHISNRVKNNSDANDFGERQTCMSYVIAVPVNTSNGTASIELIDNPFMDRPADFGFNGWVVNNVSTPNTFTTNISTDTATWTQTLNVSGLSYTEGASYTIDLNADWKVANVIYVNAGSNNGNGLTPTTPTNTIANAITKMNNLGYKTSSTVSDRELNILVLVGGTLDLSAPSRAITITSLDSGNDYRTNANLRVNDDISLSNDLQIDFVSMYDNAGTSLTSSSLAATGNAIICNNRNLRIGRGMMESATNRYTVTQINGGTNGGNNTNSRKFKLVTETGRYELISVGAISGISDSNNTHNGIEVVGCDFDRINNNNDDFYIYCRLMTKSAGGSNWYNTTFYSLSNPLDASIDLYKVIVKSGTIGVDYFEDYLGNDNSDYPYSGIYIGGAQTQYGYDYGNRTLIVEGGNIANINGGLKVDPDDKVNTYIYVKGGTVANITAGAGRSETYGDRYVCVTGGTIRYSVNGGSNGIYANDDNRGTLGGSTYVYVGGNAVIGGEDENGDILYGVLAGSVLGAGNGNTNYKGSVDSTHIVIDGNATVNGNVFGGGNYGVVGNSYNSPTDFSLATIQYHDINGPVSFSAGNTYLFGRNGNYAGRPTRATENTIEYTDDISNYLWALEDAGGGTYYIRNVATGEYIYRNNRNNVGIAYSTANRLAFTYSDNKFSFIRNGTRYYLQFNTTSGFSFTNSNSTSNNNLVYAYSYTDLDIPDQSTTDIGTTKAQIDIYGGTIKRNVYGGSNQSDVYGTTVINMSADSTQTKYESETSSVIGTVEGTIYGGSNESGVIHSSTVININAGTIGTEHTSNLGNYDAVFGGGKGYDTTVNGNTIINITDEKGDVTINGCVYGGSEQGSIELNDNVYVGDNKSEDNKIALNGNIYGGGKGTNGTGNVHSASTGGSSIVKVDGGAYNNPTNSITQVYGGCNVLGTVGGKIKVEIGENYSTDVYQVYGGGNQAEVTTSTKKVDVELYKNAKVTDAFNGGNSAGIEGDQTATPRIIHVDGAKVDNVYGGSNSEGDLTETHVLIENGAEVKNAYGGGLGENTNITGNTEVIVKGYDEATLAGDSSLTNTRITNDVYGGGSDGTVEGNTNVQIENSNVVHNVYGGGYGEDATATDPLATVSGDANVSITGSTIGNNVYGSGYGGKVEGSTTVLIDKTTVTGDAFGGGYGATATVGTEDTPTTASISVIGTEDERSTVKNVYGGGDLGKVFGNTVVTTECSTINQSIYGGGNQADITDTASVTLLDKSTAGNVYGGGNNGVVESSTSVGIYDGSHIANSVYGGGNLGDVIQETSVVIDDSVVDNNVFGGGKSADAKATTVIVQDSTIANTVYGGGDQGLVNATGVENATSVVITNSTVVNAVYGGGNGAESGTNNPGKVNGNTIVTITDSTIGTTAGGTVDENDPKAVAANVDGIGNVFGAGCGVTANVTGNAKVVINNTSIKNDVYGGGDNGSVSGSTDVELNKATVGGSAYAAGNGTHAVVGVGTHIVAHNDTEVGKSLFGGGNKALTGDYTSGSVVDIVGAIIGENVYGSSNQSAIYGDATVNIGKKAVDDYYGSETSYTKSKIDIAGTVYGGGESFDPTSTNFNFDTVSVEGNINITIDGTGYDTSDSDTIDIHGSIFGSGNASRAALVVDPTATEKTYITNNGNIYIKNYGSADNIKKLVSIQRGGQQDSENGIDNEVVLENSYLYISGTTDSTSAHPTELFSLNRLGVLKLKGGTTVYLVNGANLLESYQSLAADGSDAVVNIADGEVNTSTSDDINRIYMHEGINFNVAKDENVTVFGRVKGMTYFGLFTEKGADSMFSGMYDVGYGSVGDSIAYVDRNFAGAYAVGLHYKVTESDGSVTEQDITKDGFYTVFEKFTTEPDVTVEVTEENYDSFGPTVYIDYITPTPEEDVYYMWFCGPDAGTKYYSISLFASKYSTLGVKELSLTGVSYSNAKVKVTDVESYLEDGIILKNKTEIPNINEDADAANNEFALAMKTGNVGWSMNGATNFLYDYNGEGELEAKKEGTLDYLIENSTVSPTLNFYLYSSNNLTEEKSLGRYRIYMDVTYKLDYNKWGKAKIIIDCQLATKMYTDSGYNAAITPGKQYEIFSSTTTNITSDSSFSTFFEFAEPNFTDFLDDKGFTSLYENSYRLITTDYVFPENTTITMVDISSTVPKYYYYIVTAEDEANGRTAFKLRDFYEMGTTDKHYDEDAMRSTYLSSDDFEYEAFIFITDFIDADFKTDAQTICENKLFRFYLNAEDTTVIDDGTPEGSTETVEVTLMKMLDDQIERTNYSVYNVESVIGVNALLSDDRVYTGANTTLTVNTTYQVVIMDSARIHDTKHFDEKLGTKLTFYKLDNDGNYVLDDSGNKVQVSGSELLGSYFTVGGNYYYPRADGTTRIKIADKVSNATTPVIFNTGNSSLNGKYEIVIESFGSADGVYYGIESSASTTVRLTIVDALFGLDAHIPEEQAIVDMTTGHTDDELGYISDTNSKIDVTVDYSSVLTEPIITVSLYRRQYDEVNPVSMEYNIVDLDDYVTDTLTPIDTSASDETPTKIEYIAFDKDALSAAVAADETPESEDGTQLTTTYNLDESLVSGTYKLVYTLYDHSLDAIYINEEDEATGVINQVLDHYEDVYNYIGETFVYIVIK